MLKCLLFILVTITLLLSGCGVGGSSGPGAPAVSLTLSSTSVQAGTDVTVSWSAPDATNCTGTQGLSGGLANKGSATFKPTTSGSVQYAISCVGIGGATTQTATLTVTAASVATLSTSSILCPYADSGNQSMATRGTNAAAPTVMTLPFTYSWNCSGTSRTLTSNGVPNHPFNGGNFATAILPQVTSTGAPSISVSYTVTPALATATSAPQFAGYTINGLKMEPGTAGTCTDAGVCNEAGGGSGTWRMEALSANKWDFGVDSNHSHVQPTGEYHIHGMPENLMAKLAKGQAMTLIGWAADGFPIYARYGYTNPNDAKSAIKVLTGSWRTKGVPDAGRPAISVYAMGSFRQDWEYIAGSGDLDECNGRWGVTPEFPNGIYYYAITDTYPFIHRCVKGVVSGAGGPPPGAPSLPPPGPPGG